MNLICWYLSNPTLMIQLPLVWQVFGHANHLSWVLLEYPSGRAGMGREKQSLPMLVLHDYKSWSLSPFHPHFGINCYQNIGKTLISSWYLTEHFPFWQLDHMSASLPSSLPSGLPTSLPASLPASLLGIDQIQ